MFYKEGCQAWWHPAFGKGHRVFVGTESLEKGRTFPSETKTSFQRDLERMDKPNEGDLFVDTMNRMAKELGVEVGMIRGIAGEFEETKAGRESVGEGDDAALAAGLEARSAVIVA